MSNFFNAKGEVQEVKPELSWYAEAAARGMSLQQYVNVTYPTNAEQFGSAWHQILASEGICVQPNRDLGIRTSTMKDIVHGPQAGAIVKEAVPGSRILFPAVIMAAIEDKLVASLTMTSNAFEQMIAVDEAITGERYEQPKI